MSECVSVWVFVYNINELYYILCQQVIFTPLPRKLNAWRVSMSTFLLSGLFVQMSITTSTLNNLYIFYRQLKGKMWISGKKFYLKKVFYPNECNRSINDDKFPFKGRGRVGLGRIFTEVSVDDSFRTEFCQ